MENQKQTENLKEPMSRRGGGMRDQGATISESVCCAGGGRSGVEGGGGQVCATEQSYNVEKVKGVQLESCILAKECFYYRSLSCSLKCQPDSSSESRPLLLPPLLLALAPPPPAAAAEARGPPATLSSLSTESGLPAI